MTTQQLLSVAAARDEIDYYRRAIDGCDRKLAKLRDAITATDDSRAEFVANLEWAEDELAAAEDRDTQADADVAEAEGGV